MHAVTVRHGFEAAHRLPHLEGKCQSLHGHSWTAVITVTAPELAAGVLVEFGAWKTALRGWIDGRLDHGSMLGPDDPLAPLLLAHDCKVYLIPGWPTVENVARTIAAVAGELLDAVPVKAPGAAVAGVRVRETSVNEASWFAA